MSSTSSKTAAFDRFPISDSGSIAIEHHKAQSDVEKAKRAKARDSDSEDPGNLISRDPEPSARRKSSVVNIEKIQVKDVKNPHVNHGNAEDPWADTPQHYTSASEGYFLRLTSALRKPYISSYSEPILPSSATYSTAQTIIHCVPSARRTFSRARAQDAPHEPSDKPLQNILPSSNSCTRHLVTANSSRQIGRRQPLHHGIFSSSDRSGLQDLLQAVISTDHFAYDEDISKLSAAGASSLTSQASRKRALAQISKGAENADDANGTSDDRQKKGMRLSDILNAEPVPVKFSPHRLPPLTPCPHRDKPFAVELTSQKVTSSGAGSMLQSEKVSVDDVATGDMKTANLPRRSCRLRRPSCRNGSPRNIVSAEVLQEKNE